MNIIQFFLLHHNRLYFEPSGIRNRISGLDDTQMRSCQYNLNSIAWILWHMTRCEDVGINRLVCESSQVFDEDNWAEKLNVSRRDIGTSMTFQEVIDLSSKINLVALSNYNLQVAQKVQSTIQNVKPEDLDKIPNSIYLHKVLFDEGALCKNSEWVAEHYFNKTKGWFLGHLGLTHGKGHLGQIIFIKKLYGLGSGE
jgi:hypothetical protein